MSASPPPLRRVQHVGLKVHDLDTAVAFYRDVLGLRVSDRYEPGDYPHSPWGICFMRGGSLHHDISLVAYPKDARLHPRPDGMRDPGVGLHHVAFQVDGKEALEAWADHLRARGVEIVRGPLVHSPGHPEGDGTLGENRSFYFYDPSGNGIEIFCDMAEVDEEANRVNESWLRDRLERDGYAREAAEPPPAWVPGRSSIQDIWRNSGTPEKNPPGKGSP